MHYEQNMPENGWRNVMVSLSPEAVDALKIVQEKNPQASISEVVSQCLGVVAEVPVKAIEPDGVLAGILQRLERVEGEVEQLQAQAPRLTTRNRTTIKKVELAKLVAEWMVGNNKRGIQTVDLHQVWQELKSQSVVIHATPENFRLWFKRNKDRIKAEMRSA